MSRNEHALQTMSVVAIGWLLASTGCGLDMADQPRLEPLEASSFFSHGQSARPLVEGTVARGHLQIDDAFFTGKANGKSVTKFPQDQVVKRLQLSGDDASMRAAILNRGRERYDIFCSVCHDQAGTGLGMVVQRGFPAPPTYHSDRLRSTPVGHFYDVVTNGFGRMPDYADQIPPADRWAIVAYVLALQLSQQASVEELPESDQQAFQSGRRPDE